MSYAIKRLVYWVVIAISALLLFQVVKSKPAEPAVPEIGYTQFVAQVEAGQVARVTLTGNRIRGLSRSDKKEFWLFGPTDQGLYLNLLREKGVEVWFKDQAGEAGVLQLLGTWLPLLLLGALWFFMIRQMQKRNSSKPEA